MGLLDGFRAPKHAALAQDGEDARRLAQYPAFADFARSANDRIEAVPGDSLLFAFVGKPPKAFGIVWFDAEQRYDVPTMVKHGVISHDSAARLAEELRTIYESSSGIERFEAEVGGHRVIVTPSAELHEKLRQAMERAVA